MIEVVARFHMLRSPTMSDSVNDWVSRLSGLPSDDRAEIAFQLLQSLPADETDPDWEAAWAAELQRRDESIENGQAVEERADEVIASLRKKYS
jgi:putative addiction module component (TIGR02574 family)